MLEIQNLKMLKALHNHTDGEIVFVSDEQTMYKYSEEVQDWIPVPKNTPLDTGLTMYDLNKMVIAQTPELNDTEVQKKKLEIGDYIKITQNQVYMLLFKDISYYTVFIGNFADRQPMEQEVIECLQYLGAIKAIEVDTEANMVECWIHQRGEEQPIAGYFFAYDGGTILCS